MKFIKDLVEKIKNLWNVYGGIALSTLIAWLTNWSKIEMDRWASYLLLTITCISLLTFFKVILGKRKKGISDKIMMQQKQIKTINTALYPEAIGEEIGSAILYTLEGGKKMKDKILSVLKLMWGNKYTTISLLLNLFYTGLSQYLLYSDKLKTIGFFVENRLLCTIVATSISVVWLIIELVKDVKNYGFESLNDLNKKWAERKARKEAKLTPEQRKLVKQQINSLDERVAVILSYIEEVEGKLELAQAVVNRVKDYNSLGLAVDTELASSFAKSQEEIVRYNNDLARLNNDKNNIDNQIIQLKAKL